MTKCATVRIFLVPTSFWLQCCHQIISENVCNFCLVATETAFKSSLDLNGGSLYFVSSSLKNAQQEKCFRPSSCKFQAGIIPRQNPLSEGHYVYEDVRKSFWTSSTLPSAAIHLFWWKQRFRSFSLHAGLMGLLKFFRKIRQNVEFMIKSQMVLNGRRTFWVLHIILCNR